MFGVLLLLLLPLAGFAQHTMNFLRGDEIDVQEILKIYYLCANN
jgi:hypothetical protein